VAATSQLEDVPRGFTRDEEVTALMVARVLRASALLRARVSRVGQHDPVSEDMLIGFLKTLELRAWMLQAQTMTPERKAPAAKVTHAASPS